MHRIFAGLTILLVALGAYAQTPIPLPLTGNLSQMLGSPAPYAGIKLALQNCPSPITITGSSVIVQTGAQIKANASGIVNSSVWPNDLINCNGTTGQSMYSEVAIVNGVPSGTVQCYQVLSTQGQWNLNVQQPIACTEPPPNPQDAQFRNLNMTGCLSVQGGPCAIQAIVPVTSFGLLQTAVTACGINPCTIAVAANIPVTSNYTIPANVNLMFAGQLQPSTGVTLTVSGSVTAPPVQIFGGAGTIAGLSIVRPEWLPAPTITAAVNALSANGGIVQLGMASYLSASPGLLTKNNVSIQGVQVPYANAGNTAFVAGSGSIIQGVLGFNASSLSFSNFGMDVGNTYNHCSDYGLEASPGTITAPMLYNITATNITVLACDHTFSPATTQHGLLFEHVTGLTETNILTINGYFGNVVKAINANLTNIRAIGVYNYSAIIKSDDNNGISTNVVVNGMNITNGGPLAIDTYGGTVSNVTINGFVATGMTSSAIVGHIAADPGTSSPGIINGVKISGGYINGTAFDAVTFDVGVLSVDLSHLTISNVTGNGIVFKTIGAATNNTIEAVNLNTVSGYGVYTFGGNDMASGVTCNAVASGCLLSSGSTSHLYTSNIFSTTALATNLASGSVLQGQFINPTLGVTGIMRSAASVTLTALNTPVSLPGTTSVSGLLTLRDGTLGGVGAYLVDPNGLVTVLNNAQVPTITVTDSGGSGFVVQVAVTSGVVPRTIVWSLQGAD